jgi:hypothetical protein
MTAVESDELLNQQILFLLLYENDLQADSSKHKSPQFPAVATFAFFEPTFTLVIKPTIGFPNRFKKQSASSIAAIATAVSVMSALIVFPSITTSTVTEPLPMAVFTLATVAARSITALYLNTTLTVMGEVTRRRRWPTTMPS